jgi:hypothetical protein
MNCHRFTSFEQLTQRPPRRGSPDTPPKTGGEFLSLKTNSRIGIETFSDAKLPSFRRRGARRAGWFLRFQLSPVRQLISSSYSDFITPQSSRFLRLFIICVDAFIDVCRGGANALIFKIILVIGKFRADVDYREFSNCGGFVAAET